MDDEGAGPSSAAQAGSLQRQAIRGSFWTLFSTAGSIPVALLGVVVAGRLLGPSGFGRFSLYVFYITVGLLIVDLGLGSSQVWSATAGRASDEKLLFRTLRGCMTWNLGKVPFVMAASALMLREERGAALLLMLGLGAHLLVQGLRLATMADRRYGAMARVSLFEAVTSSGGVIAAAVLTRSPEWTVAAFWAGKALAVPVIYVSTPGELRRSALTPGSMRMDKVSLTFGGSNYLYSLMTTWVTGRSELVFLERTGDGAAQGQFALATTVASRATLLADALYGALGIAMLALRSVDAGRLEEGFQRALRLTTLLALATSACLTASAALLAPPLFGDDYGSVALPTALLLQAALLRTAWQPLFTWVFTERVNRALLIPGATAVVVDVALSLVLIPANPFAGAVIANVVSGVLFMVLTAATARLTPVAQVELRRCTLRFVIVAATSASAVALPWSISPGWWSLIGHAAGATVLAVLLSVCILRLFPPLLSDQEIDSITRGSPRFVRPAFRTICFCFNGSRVLTKWSLHRS